VLSWLEADVAAASNAVKRRIKGGVITPLPTAKPSPAAAKPPPAARPAAAAAVAADSLAVAETQAGSASSCDVIELPAAGSAAAAAAVAAENCEPHNDVWLDVKFTLVEPRVKGGAVMARASSNPRSSSRLGCDSPTTGAADDSGMSMCSNSQSLSAANQLSGARVVDVWSLDAAIRPRKPAWQFPAAARTSFNISNSSSSSNAGGSGVQLLELQPNDAVLHPRQGLGVVCFESGWQQQQQSSSSSGRADLRELLLAARSNSSAR
jgi:hypothetical protein